MIRSMNETWDDAAVAATPPMGIPAIDVAAPAAFETATFALG